MAAREQELELQQTLYRHRTETGVRALRSLIIARRDAVNTVWIDSAGEELLQYQGEARSLRKLLRMIDDGPTNKGE